MNTQLNFFNSISLSGEALRKMIEQCNRQEGRVLEIMSDGRQFSPFDVMRIYNSKYPEVPITSIRRCMTCLTQRDFLIKCDRMKMGEYNMPNHTWSIKFKPNDIY